MDIERAIEFILDQQAKFQAQFAAALQKHDERITRLEEAQQRTDDMIRQLVDVNFSLVNHIEQLANNIQQVDERLSKRIEELTEAQSHTDYKLNALIDTVDKLVRRDGSPSAQA